MVFVAYPLVPWIGVTAVGYALGQIYAGTAIAAARSCCVSAWPSSPLCGAAHGQRLRRSRAWATLASTALTILSFLNTTKQPPSLLFLMMTLGPALLFPRAGHPRRGC